MKLCIECGKKKVHCKNMCDLCYRHICLGRGARKPAMTCSKDGCEEKAKCRGLCHNHYVHKTRDPVNERRFDFRRRYQSEWPEEWNDRAKFIADVGEMPGPRYRLRKIDQNSSISKTNIHWVAPLQIEVRSSVDTVAYHRSSNRLRKYGITDEAYRNILASQGGCCAICRKKTDKLWVDHCHAGNGVRGLLCNLCNSGIGYLKEDLMSLGRAIVYISGHKNQPTHDVIDLLKIGAQLSVEPGMP